MIGLISLYLMIYISLQSARSSRRYEFKLYFFNIHFFNMNISVTILVIDLKSSVCNPDILLRILIQVIVLYIVDNSDI